MCIPPILTLLDDSNTRVRARGLHIFTDLLDKISAETLRQTGLGEVFENAIFPTLLLLPSLTPVDESILVLGPAYEALFKLGKVRFPKKTDRAKMMSFLDKVLRHGLLQGLLHARGVVAIVELLLESLSLLLENMGTHAVKHLKVWHSRINIRSL